MNRRIVSVLSAVAMVAAAYSVWGPGRAPDREAPIAAVPAPNTIKAPETDTRTRSNSQPQAAAGAVDPFHRRAHRCEFDNRWHGITHVAVPLGRQRRAVRFRNALGVRRPLSGNLSGSNHGQYGPKPGTAPESPDSHVVLSLSEQKLQRPCRYRTSPWHSDPQIAR